MMTLEDLKEAGSGRAAPKSVRDLYSEAFKRFGARTLWSRHPVGSPTIAHAVAIAQSLRREGDMPARRLAERIEDACRAAL